MGNEIQNVHFLNNEYNTFKSKFPHSFIRPYKLVFTHSVSSISIYTLYLTDMSKYLHATYNILIIHFLLFTLTQTINFFGCL